MFHIASQNCNSQIENNFQYIKIFQITPQKGTISSTYLLKIVILPKSSKSPQGGTISFIYLLKIVILKLEIISYVTTISTLKG